MADEGEVKGRGALESHPLVELFVPDPNGPVVPLRRLFGFLDMRNEGIVRLWSPDFSSHADIPPDAIRHSQTLGDGGATMLMIDPAAKVTFGLMQPAASQGQFLTGSITAAHLSGAVAPPVARGGELGPPWCTTWNCFSFLGCGTWFFC